MAACANKTPPAIMEPLIKSLRFNLPLVSMASFFCKSNLYPIERV